MSQRGFEVTTHIVTPDIDNPQRFEPWPELADYDVIIVMGSIRSLTNKAEISNWIHDELSLLAAAHERGQPILGVCFGGQLMAEVLGATVEVAPVTEIGWYEIWPVEGAQNPVGPGPWLEWHHDRFSAPPGSTVLAETENALQLFSHGTTVGTQFHPEVDVDHLVEWLLGVEDDYLNAHGATKEQILADVAKHEAHNAQQCYNLVDWWLDEIAFPQGLSLPATSQTESESAA